MHERLATLGQRPALAQTTVHVRDMQLMADIGINPDEIGRSQLLLVSVALKVESQIIDHLDETIDYRIVAAAASTLAHQHIGLIETFAHRLGEQCLACPGVSMAEVRVDKPGALPNGTASVTVMVERRPD